MTTSLSDPQIWQVVAAILGVGIVMWRYMRFVNTAHDRADLLVDGWITRFSDDPAEYRAEERRLLVERRKNIGYAVAVVVLQVVVWTYF